MQDQRYAILIEPKMLTSKTRVASSYRASLIHSDENNNVLRVAEKEPISSRATVGIYYIKHGYDFINACASMVSRNDLVNDEFYTAPSYNYLIKDRKKIGYFDIPMTAMHGLWGSLMTF